MVHDYHPSLEGYDPAGILFDGCGECEARSQKGIKGLLDLDASNIELLWRRCLNTSYGGLRSHSLGGEEAGRYRSGCEARLGHQLYLIGVLLERQGRDIWKPGSFQAPVQSSA